MICIESALNGWTVSEVGEDEQYVFEFGLTDKEEAEAIQRMLYQVLESLGLRGSKHDPYRVRVVVEGPKADEDEAAPCF